MIKLYYAANTCALASHIALEEAAAEYATVRISFANEEQRKPEYLAINPKGRAPHW
jgi:glutathione S-transferase